MKRAIIGAAAGAALSSGLAGCGGGGGGANAEGCKAAMAQEYRSAFEHPDGPKGTRPPQCVGISDSQLVEFAGEAIFATTAP